MGIVVYILVILLVITIHEMGHLVAARALGIPVPAFNVGFGPRLVSVKALGTQWSLRVIPLGGYVTMDEERMEGASVWRRVVVFLGGPLANLAPLVALGVWLVGWRLSLLLLWVTYRLTLWGVWDTLRGSLDWILGPQYVEEVVHPAPHTSELMGPVGSAHVTGQMVAHSGLTFTVILTFTLMSIGVALFNLLPVPPLDGGRVVVALLEVPLGRERAERLGGWLVGLGCVVVVWLMAVVLYHDVLGLF